MPLRMPGLRSEFLRLKEEYGVKTYAELVEELEIEHDDLSRPLAGFLKNRRGKVTVDTAYSYLLNRGIKTRKRDVEFLLKLRKLFRLPAPGGTLVGPRHENPILTLLGTYGPLRRHEIVDRLDETHYEDPLVLLADIYDKVVIKYGRSLDQRRLKLQEKAIGSVGRYILLSEPLEFADTVEKFSAPVVEISKLVRYDAVIIPLHDL